METIRAHAKLLLSLLGSSVLALIVALVLAGISVSGVTSMTAADVFLWIAFGIFVAAAVAVAIITCLGLSGGKSALLVLLLAILVGVGYLGRNGLSGWLGRQKAEQVAREGTHNPPFPPPQASPSQGPKVAPHSNPKVPSQPPNLVPKTEPSETPDSGLSIDGVCIALTNAFLDHRSVGWALTNGETEVPLIFKSRSDADLFLSASKGHGRLCWEPTIEDDLKGGFDVFVVWRDSANPSWLPAPVVPFNPFLTYGLECRDIGSAAIPPLTIEQDEERGAFYIKSGQDEFLTVNSLEKANQILNLGLGAVCVVSLSGDKKHPFVAFSKY